MTDSTEVQPSRAEVDEELAAAQRQLTAIQARVAKAEQMKLDAAAAAVANRKRREEEALQAERDKIAAQVAARKAREAEAQRIAEAEARAKREEEIYLEQQLAKAEESKRVREKREAEIRKITEQAHQLEQEARTIEAEALRAQQFFAPAEPEVNVSSGTGPLARIIFNRDGQPASEQPTQGLSSEQQSRIQNELDRKAEALAAIARGEQPAAPVYAAEPAPVIPQERTSRRKTKAYADGATSLELESLLRRNLHISPNPGRCDQLSEVWEASDLLETAKRIIVNCQGKPMSHDYVFAMLEIALQAPMVEEAGAQHVVTQA